MGRIVYSLVGLDKPTGGHKVVVRHVETLAAHGFTAVLYLPDARHAPSWIDSAVEITVRVHDDDIVVLPEDAPSLFSRFAAVPNRRFVFCQNHYFGAAVLHGRFDADWPYRDYIACSRAAATWIAKHLPHRSIGVVPAFADERRFRVGAKRAVIACTPRKRPLETAAIRFMVSRLYLGATEWSWAPLDGASEETVARAFGEASVFLSLSRLEGLGMATLEAMASGCIVAGFTGLGGREYASPVNGLWVGEDDCEACAGAVVEAMVAANEGGARAVLLREAARETAARWSYAAFVTALVDFWRARMEGPAS